MRSLLGRASRALNRMMGGEPDTSICGAVAKRWGADCLFCRVIGAILFDPDHCRKEIE